MPVRAGGGDRDGGGSLGKVSTVESLLFVGSRVGQEQGHNQVLWCFRCTHSATGPRSPAVGDGGKGSMSQARAETHDGSSK